MTRRRRWRRETAGDNKYGGHWLVKKWWHYYFFYLILCMLWRLLEGCKPKKMGRTATNHFVITIITQSLQSLSHLITCRHWRWRHWFYSSIRRLCIANVTTRSIINRRVLLSFPHEWIIESNKSLLITSQPIAKSLRHHVFIFIFLLFLYCNSSNNIMHGLTSRCAVTTLTLLHVPTWRRRDICILLLFSSCR